MRSRVWCEAGFRGGTIQLLIRALLQVETDFATPTSRRKAPFNKELAENSGIGKLFTNAMESLDEEEKDYYFSNSDSAQ